MKIKLKITRYTIGYTAFAIVALIVFLYLRFPGDALIRHLVSSASYMNPNQFLLIDSAKPIIPPGITFTNVALGFHHNPLSTIQADAITVSPGYLSLLKSRTGVSFAAIAYGGAIQGQVGTNHFLSFRGPLHWRLTADGLDIEKISYLKDILNRRITGRFKGTLTFNGQFQSFVNGTGSLEFTLINGSFQLLERIVGIDRLDFKKVEGLVNFRNGIVTISKLKLIGEKVNGALSGDITLNTTDVNRSEINLNYVIELPDQNNKKISMVLTGLLGKPAIKYM
jgi:type II secretion system protein N